VSIPKLVAHRGWPRRYPENTLIAVAAALAGGAEFVEVDVQLSADGVPVLYHDADLLRVSGREGRIHELTLAEIRELEAWEPGRFGERFRGTRVPTLAAFTELLRRYPEARAFVEIKTENLATFGADRVAGAVLEALKFARGQTIPISFDTGILARVRLRSQLPIGWILPRWNKDTETIARGLAPEYLFCSARRLPLLKRRLWPGDWYWGAYVANTPAAALKLAARGMVLVETDDIGTLLAAPKLRPRDT
jgi:glycerophosphoryl diester phosphodiesterase